MIRSCSLRWAKILLNQCLTSRSKMITFSLQGCANLYCCLHCLPENPSTLEKEGKGKEACFWHPQMFGTSSLEIAHVKKWGRGGSVEINMAAVHIPSHLILNKRKNCFFPNGSYIFDYWDTAAAATQFPLQLSVNFSLCWKENIKVNALFMVVIFIITIHNNWKVEVEYNIIEWEENYLQ